ncbi:Checkpoint protein Rad17/Rad24 [Penicillium malachiteum]|nr:Checkpoint protein Rad17/Rad24 [Penicillium malachiteum]
MDHGPPTKRQRRSTRTDQSSKSIAPASSKIPSRQKPSAHPPSSVSPEPSPPKTKSKSLHNFFKPATEGQRWSSQKFETKITKNAKPVKFEKFEAKRPLSTAETLDVDEIEDDYDSYDEIFTQHIASQSIPSRSTSIASKHVLFSSLPAKTKAPARRPPNKRFIIPVEPQDRARSPSQIVDEIDTRPWSQRFAPSNLDELVVHKRKVADVQRWLEDAFAGRCREKLLVLRGPAGSGKTTTISLLADALGFDIVEWRNPAVSAFTSQDYVSIGAQFEEYLGRGEHFGGLDLKDDKTKSCTRDKRILLVEEFPVLNSTSALSAFRTSIQRYLAAASDHALGAMHPPIVMIVSETLLGSASSISDNFTVHRLLGPVLFTHASTKIIDFNSVAPTYMQKALRLILEKEARNSKRSRIPGPAVLETIAEIGDIRSAVSSLEFLCLKNENSQSAWSGTLAKTKGKKVPKDMTPMEEESLKMISQREASLGIFHAVGKIMYNKRLDPSLAPPGTIALPSPPEYLSEHRRNKVSQVAVDDLADEAGTDITTFICGLHENYPASCHGSEFTDHLNACIEVLSDSDILSTDRPSRGARGGAGTGMYLGSSVDKLRQDDMSFQVAARGLLFGLPYPVNRQLKGSDGGRLGDAFRMLYPKSLRLWRKAEEIDGMVDSCMKQMLDPSSHPHLSQTQLTGVSSWRSLRIGHVGGSEQAVTMLSRSEALLYQFPYMAQIQRDRPNSWHLNQFTKIQSIRFDQNENEDEDDPVSPPLSRPRTVGPQQEEKLILSDDDIED